MGFYDIVAFIVIIIVVGVVALCLYANRGFFSAVKRLATDVSDPRDEGNVCPNIIGDCYDYLDSFNVDPNRPLYFYRPKEYGIAGGEALCNTFYFEYSRNPFMVSRSEKTRILRVCSEGNEQLYLRDFLSEIDNAYHQYGNELFKIAFESPIEGEIFYSESFRWEFDEEENAIILFGEFRTEDVIDLFKPKTGAFIWF